MCYTVYGLFCGDFYPAFFLWVTMLLCRHKCTVVVILGHLFTCNLRIRLTPWCVCVGHHDLLISPPSLLYSLVSLPF